MTTHRSLCLAHLRKVHQQGSLHESTDPDQCGLMWTCVKIPSRAQPSRRSCICAARFEKINVHVMLVKGA